MVLWKALIGKNRRTTQCIWGAVRKRWKLVSEEESYVTAMNFSSHGLPVEMVIFFKYLVGVI